MSALSMSRRAVLSGVASSAALVGASMPAIAVDTFEWTISNDEYSGWFFFEGDKVVLARNAVPMDELG